MLLTNTVGLFTLLRAQSDPIGTAIAFVLAGVMIFTPLVLAVAVGLAGRAK
jgi:tetrahydromethanopterin S-methyltransferase subunit F